MGRGRRSFLSLAAGIGLGTVVAEIYERLYNIPSLEKRFSSEVNHWINEYNSAKEMVEKLSQQLNVSGDEISRLSAEVNNWKDKYNAAKEEANKLSSIVNASDAFEKESATAISLYKERIEEAIRALQNTIEKYRVILGDERVSFESSSLKVLDDLKITREKILKLLPYFPLIKIFGYSHSRVVNDKIYDLSVSLEVISPLNTLEEVEIKLIPVEYSHLPKEAFPEEEIRSIKLQPKGLEREMFDIAFADLKGGREYDVRAIAEDASGQSSEASRRTSYIREFENNANPGIGAIYYPYFRSNSESTQDNWSGFTHWNWGYDGSPSLGEYSSRDPIVISRHIDEATGKGRIGHFLMSWWGPSTQGHHDAYIDRNIRDYFLRSPLAKDIRFSIFYESLGRLRATDLPTGGITINLDDEFNRKILTEDFDYLSKTYFPNAQYFTVNGAEVVFLYLSKFYSGDLSRAVKLLRRVAGDNGYDLYVIGDEVDFRDPSQIPFIDDRLRVYDSVSTYTMYVPIEGILSDFENNVDLAFGRWHRVTRRLGVPLIPNVTIGFDNRNWHRGFYGTSSGFPVLEKNVGRVRRLIRIAKKYSTDETLKIIFNSFNSFEEGAYLERTKEFGYELLEAISKEDI
jgi:hypothetical protein